MDDADIQVQSKRGYLNEDFLFFHLRDSKSELYEYHYHDFYKIIIFISGKVTYLIDGKGYALKPWDILLVSNRDIHKAVIDTSEPYERIVIWLNPRCLEKNSGDDGDLLSCFDKSSAARQSLVHPAPDELLRIKNILADLETACAGGDTFGKNAAKNALFLLLVIHLNRICLKPNAASKLQKPKADAVMHEIIDYINENIGGDLSIEHLSQKYFMSRYTLMHKFKKQTGFTVHSFILQKRLLTAGSLIKGGCPVSKASADCGFDDYTSFVRAFKKLYGVPPTKY